MFRVLSKKATYSVENTGLPADEHWIISSRRLLLRIRGLHSSAFWEDSLDMNEGERSSGKTGSPLSMLQSSDDCLKFLSFPFEVYHEFIDEILDSLDNDASK